MTKAWPKGRLGQVLQRVKDEILVDDGLTYARLTIRMNGKGITIRDRVLGAEIGTKKQFIARSGQLVLSKIDARNGACGILPPGCDRAIITGNFWAFDANETLIFAKYLEYLTKTPLFVDFCVRASEGTTNRLYLQEDRFLEQEIRLPPLLEQRRIVAKIDELATKIKEANKLKIEIDRTSRQLLQSAFAQITKNIKFLPMHEVAPLTRRPIAVEPTSEYPELGIRSFGNGTFHKPALNGMSVGNKKMFQIEPGDLVFNNVFAWEGAVAVAKAEDSGRFGSHRFITCVPKKELATSEFLCFYFLSAEGLEKLGQASPGGAGRNRTLGLEALSKIEVPVPQIEHQIWFALLQAKVESLKKHQGQTIVKLDALLPSILDKAFKGEL